MHKWFRSLLLTALCGSLQLPALAFDTGHHADLTRETLQEEGFGEMAIQTTQVQNWLVDYFSSSPTSQIDGELALLHFDNLFSTTSLQNYWGRLTLNTQTAVQQATRERDALKLLTLMGITLHTVQDFYSHSNWTETHPATNPSVYRAVTWFDAPPQAQDSLYTGSYPDFKPGAQVLHGDYFNGLNKDSYVRPGWDAGYVNAYAASRQWLNAIKGWVQAVDPAFWTTVQQYTVTGSTRTALQKDLDASYRISEWVGFTEDGHWKGNGSGDELAFTPYAATWAASPDSIFVQQFKTAHTYRLISDGLTGATPPPSPPPMVAPILLNRRAVILRTLQVTERNDLGVFELGIDPGGKPDFYAQITVAGQVFIEAMQLDRSTIQPAWTTLKFVPTSQTQVSFNYQLWDEDSSLRGNDDRCDINPTASNRSLSFTFNPLTDVIAGNVNGLAGSTLTSQGVKPDTNRAILQFSVTDRGLQQGP